MVRDLHDGAPARLVHAPIALQLATGRDDLPSEVRSLVEEGLTHARRAIEELRDLAHGIHPAILTRSGLAAAVRMLADHTSLPVEVLIPGERYAAEVESAAYFVAAEGLTNVAKYARGSRVWIRATRTPTGLRLVVRGRRRGGRGVPRRPGGSPASRIGSPPSAGS